VPTDPRTAATTAARELVRSLAGMAKLPSVRVVDVEGSVACLVLVWNTDRPMPVAAAERRKRTGGRQECKRDVVQVVRDAGQALTRKEVVKALRLAAKDHGPGTVAKALADLTAAGELVNLKDKRGYRLPEWRRGATPSLFD
jgi:hypothetical protein